jgi:hypothetical protein
MINFLLNLRFVRLFPFHLIFKISPGSLVSKKEKAESLAAFCLKYLFLIPSTWYNGQESTAKSDTLQRICIHMTIISIIAVFAFFMSAPPSSITVFPICVVGII